MKKILLSFLFFSFACFVLPLFFLGCSKEEYRRLRIAVDPNWYPYDFQNLLPNVNGFIADVLLEISKREKVEFEKIHANWDSLLDGLKEKNADIFYDLVLTVKEPHNFNEVKYCFSSPFLYIGPVILFPSVMNFQAIKDLENKRVGIVGGDEAIHILELAKGPLIISYPSLPEMLLALEKKMIDAALADRLLAIAYMKNIYAKKFSVSSPLNDVGIRFLSLKNHPMAKTMERFDKVIKEMKEDKTLERLQRKWQLS